MARLFLAGIVLTVFLAASSCGKLQSSMDIIKAETAYNQGNFAKAIELYTQLIEINPSDPVLYHKLGIAYYSSGNKLKVEKQITKLRNLNNNELADDLQQLLDKQ